MKKILLSLLYFFLFGASLVANPVGKEKAMEVARNFFGQGNPNKIKEAEVPIKRVLKANSKNDQIPFFIINNEDGGFVIVSNSTSTVPILAYSYQNSFDQRNIPDNLGEWLDQISEIITKEWNSVQTPDIAEEWNKYATRQTNSATPVTKLETAQWSQGSPFKDQCPIIDGCRCAAGCLPIALAITMRYWKWPNAGVGVLPKYAYNSAKGEGYEYDSSLEGVEGIIIGGGYELGEEYDWDSMPLYNNIEQFSEAEQYAVSHLVKDCGALLQTIYSPGASGADFDKIDKIKQFFNYDKAFTKQCADNYSYEEWTSLLKRELDEGRPILTAGGLHAYVIDGYDNNDYFSINWGWGGLNNGYYIMGPYYSNDWTGVDIYENFISQSAYIGLQPNAGGEYKYILEWYAGDKYLSIPDNSFELSKPFELCNVFASIRNLPEGSFYRGDYAAAILNQFGEIKSLISTPQKLDSNHTSQTITCQLDEPPNPGDYITIVFKSAGSSEWESILTWAYSNNAKLYLNETESLDENTTIIINPNERQFKHGYISLTTKLMTIKTMNGTAITIYRSDGSIVESFDTGWLHMETNEGTDSSTMIHYLFLSNFEPGTYTIVLNHSLQHKEISFTL